MYMQVEILSVEQAREYLSALMDHIFSALRVAEVQGRINLAGHTLSVAHVWFGPNGEVLVSIDGTMPTRGSDANIAQRREIVHEVERSVGTKVYACLDEFGPNSWAFRMPFRIDVLSQEPVAPLGDIEPSPSPRR